MIVSLRCVCPSIQYSGRLYKYLFVMIAWNVGLLNTQSWMSISPLETSAGGPGLMEEAVVSGDTSEVLDLELELEPSKQHSLYWAHRGEQDTNSPSRATTCWGKYTDNWNTLSSASPMYERWALSYSFCLSASINGDEHWWSASVSPMWSLMDQKMQRR